MSDAEEVDVDKLKVDELREELRTWKKSTVGTKEVLRARLRAAIEEENDRNQESVGEIENVEGGAGDARKHGAFCAPWFLGVR
jgi:hypothetical protein